MDQWRGYLHFLWSQFAFGSGQWFTRRQAQTLTSSLSSLRLLQDRDLHAPRIYLHESTRNEEGGRDEESDDVWGFRDTAYRVVEEEADGDGDGGAVEVTGAGRYLLSGCRLPGLLPWADAALGVAVPRRPALLMAPQHRQIPPPLCTDAAFVRALLLPLPPQREERPTGLPLRPDQVCADGRTRRRHGHGHTQEEMYELKFGAHGLARLPDLVVYPETEAQVAGIVCAARAHGVCVIPFGGGTNVTEALRCPPAAAAAASANDDGGQEEKQQQQQPPRMVVSIDMRRLDRLVWLDPVNRLAQIEAGAVGRNIAAALARRGWTMGHEPDSIEFSTLGGWIATGASGMKRNRYGNIEDLVLDMRVVMATGQVLTKGREKQQEKGGDTSISTASSSVPPRQSTGSDPLRYMFGSEGTLGIVVSAVVKLHPLPQAVDYAALLFPTWEDGVQFMYELQQQQETQQGQHTAVRPPASVRLVDNEQFRMSQALKPAPSPGFLTNTLASLTRTLEHWYILSFKGFDPHRMVACTMVFEGASAVETRAQQAAVLRLGGRHGGVSAGAANGRRGYALTYNIAYIRDFAMRHGVLGESFETAAPWSAVLPLCARVKARVCAEHAARGLPGVPLVSCRVTQLYDTGAAVYFYVAIATAGVEEPARVYAELEETAREEILAAGGALSHHHGVGRLRSRFLPDAWSEAALAWRSEVKRAVDPDNVFGVGNLVA